VSSTLLGLRTAALQLSFPCASVFQIYCRAAACCCVTAGESAAHVDRTGQDRTRHVLGVLGAAAPQKTPTSDHAACSSSLHPVGVRWELLG